MTRWTNCQRGCARSSDDIVRRLLTCFSKARFTSFSRCLHRENTFKDPYLTGYSITGVSRRVAREYDPSTIRAFQWCCRWLRPPLARAPGARDLPFRQIHLDFHTGEPRSPTSAPDFEPQRVRRRSQRARVNSINIFAKCMHGYAYYDTKIAVRHPSLEDRPVGRDAEAYLRPAGIAANYYYCLTWDALAAARHPEWRILDRDGKPVIFGGHQLRRRVAAGLPELALTSTRWCARTRRS